MPHECSGPHLVGRYPSTSRQSVLSLPAIAARIRIIGALGEVDGMRDGRRDVSSHRSIVRMVLAMLLLLCSSPAAATIMMYSCTIEGMRGPLIITIYDDGTPARIGTALGIGDKADVYFDRLSGAVVVVEKNGGGLPITLTTINRDGRVVHSRQVINNDGWFAPSQSTGACTKGLP